MGVTLGRDNQLIQTVSTELIVNTLTTAFFPTQAVLMGNSLTTGAGYIHISFDVSVFHFGGAAGTNIAKSFRWLLDSVVQQGGMSVNQIRGRISSGTLSARRVVTAGFHTVDIEWTQFGIGGTVMAVNVGSSPDLFHATLITQEEAS